VPAIIDDTDAGQGFALNAAIERAPRRLRLA
jgi:hypothetical protein